MGLTILPALMEVFASASLTSEPGMCLGLCQRTPVSPAGMLPASEGKETRRTKVRSNLSLQFPALPWRFRLVFASPLLFIFTSQLFVPGISGSSISCKTTVSHLAFNQLVQRPSSSLIYYMYMVEWIRVSDPILSAMMVPSRPVRTKHQDVKSRQLKKCRGQIRVWLN